MSIRVSKAGLLTSIQDLGRRGFQQHGVIVSGAMDSYSLRIANLLVGNDEKEAGLEVTLMGPTLEIESDCLVAITGGDLTPSVNGKPVPMWKPLFIPKGSTLSFGPCKTGCRSYLSVAGGFAIDEVLNSKSTYLRGEIGGYKGRALQTDDVLPLSVPDASKPAFVSNELVSGVYTSSWSVNYKEFVHFIKKPGVRVMNGSQYDLFTAESKSHFTKEPFKVSNQSDRMGYRMDGPSLQLQEKKELLSEAVSQGSVQVPPDGNPIILLADRQTTGGYPKIAQVITADLPLLAQVKPGESIYFSRISLHEAEKIYLEKEQLLQELKIAINLASTK
ncbi:5-oxoprolinase subunit C family protein [Priestia aryabhattai]|uniref:5-oxoprolinase subunit C family protein n=1 Tax=Priestia aryabhattai TaxID=412384 RepID=UPI001875D90A|nr:biotin-dependent carboxyltransferase family protein [Priestia aryabhattai]MBE5097854.1 biotin-dependent carboxyltransferase family protein [Priestia aryabhattai]